MPRRTSTFAKVAKELERQHRAQLRAKEKAARDLEKQYKAELRAEERQRNAQLREEDRAIKDLERARRDREKRQKLDYQDGRLSEIQVKNAELELRNVELTNILGGWASIDDFLDFDSLKVRPQIPTFDMSMPRKPILKQYSQNLAHAKSVKPPPLSGLEKLLPWKSNAYRTKMFEYESITKAKAKNERDRTHNEESLRKYTKDQDEFQKAEALHKEWVSKLLSNAKKHNEAIEQLKQDFAEGKPEAIADYLTRALTAAGQTDGLHQMEQFKHDFSAGKPEAIIDYFALVMDASDYPEDFPQHARLAYVPESKQIVIEYDLPTMEVVPDKKTYKYVKSRDEITHTPLPQTQRKRLYSSTIAQITLRTIREIFVADRCNYVDNVVFNGYVDSIDRSTGQPKRPCLVTVSTTRDLFLSINLELVDPHECLKGLNASVSPKPEELAPVRPVIEFSMVDSRFIEETDVLSELDQRQNLMELSPSEFENLITNLFGKMGLETRQTQASRDGGVDCVAFDPRPIFGGKVVIQAKRYKNTVGVSAVRDLYGTAQNEGASKGILVATSGYGKASFEFAEGKPLELLSGSNLLYLLREHAGIDAKIEAPDDWRDPSGM